MSKKVVIKRRFAVMLEDAIEVLRPSDEELAEYDDLEHWAIDNYDGLFTAACENSDPGGSNGLPKLLWEDEHHADLEFPDDEYEVETYGE